ncbi:SDR family oxidoreductase [Aliihoeflea sp. PC F10.4]
MTNKPLPTIAVLGASGLIGQAVTMQLLQDGFRVVPVARNFATAQMTAFADAAVQRPIVGLDNQALQHLLAEMEADIVVNCIGVLQDSARRGTAQDAHAGFAARLVEAMASAEKPCLLVHLSVPGNQEDDRTAFSTTKREAERVIQDGSVAFVILRPGFVVAPAAYGGSALVRALAALPFELAAQEAQRPFAATDVADITATIAIVARRWADGEHRWNAVWDVVEREPSTVEGVIAEFRRHLDGPARRLRLSSWLMGLGAKAGDLVARLGWSPPIRSTALAELRRGVTGDPQPWITATGIEPASLKSTLSRLPATVQEKWFARLYLLKPLILGVLVLFWAVSGLIPLTVAFDAASAILTAHGVPLFMAQAITVASSLADIAIGVAIAVRRTSRVGLVAGICLSVAYMASAAIITPSLWLDPLGSLVKTGPAIVLMLVALAIMDER